MSYLGTKDFGLEVALGNVTGYTKVNKFGETTNADSGTATDVWDGSVTTAIWVPPTAARVHAIASTSDVDSDTGGVVAQGAGLRTVKIYGLKTWGTAESSETVVMDGTTAVNTANSYVIIHRMHGVTWGANGVNTGVITATAATDATVTAQITAAQNQTQMMIYGVPSTQTIQIGKLIAQVVDGTGVTARANGEVLMMTDPATDVANNTAWTNKENFTAIEGQNPWTHEYEVPKSCTGPCIVKMQVTSNANNTVVIAAMDAYIVDN